MSDHSSTYSILLSEKHRHSFTLSVSRSSFRSLSLVSLLWCNEWEAPVQGSHCGCNITCSHRGTTTAEINTSQHSVQRQTDDMMTNGRYHYGISLNSLSLSLSLSIFFNAPFKLLCLSHLLTWIYTQRKRGPRGMNRCFQLCLHVQHYKMESLHRRSKAVIIVMYFL